MSLLRQWSERPLRLPRLRPYVPEPSDPAIFWFNSERQDIVNEVVDRVVTAHCANRAGMEITLNDAAFHEVRRLSAQKDAEAKESLGYWKGMVRRIARMSDDDKRHALSHTAHRMASDVAGNFDPRVYEFSRKVVPRLLTGVMRPARLPVDMFSGGPSVMDELLQVEGHIDTIRALEQKGSVVYVPTHSSNLDSIVLSQALLRAGLAPVVYGAGKNLFTNPIISFFMHNLGAYRVDRRVRASLYKDVLKAYSQVMIERGYHSLFFPGGTRSRSGLIENRLKLGLAGSAVEAFSQNQVRGIDRRVWFVPTTINYALVLEAETLIEDWLSEEGKARYIIDDDEFSRIDRWVTFFRKIVGLRAACVIRFGQPLDPFGNPVDEEGRSHTPNGDRTIDAGTYVRRRGKPTADPARDAAYTRELGEVLVERYKKETVLMTSQVVAHVLFRRLVRKTEGLDLFSRMRVRGDVTLPRDELAREVGEARDRLCDLEARGEVCVNDVVRSEDPNALVDRALRIWSGYHTRTAARDVGPEITLEDPSLLLYYQNRLVPFATEIAGEADAAAAREIATLGVYGGRR